jgi:hypothetical protein
MTSSAFSNPPLSRRCWINASTSGLVIWIVKADLLWQRFSLLNTTRSTLHSQFRARRSAIRHLVLEIRHFAIRSQL